MDEHLRHRLNDILLTDDDVIPHRWRDGVEVDRLAGDVVVCDLDILTIPTSDLDPTGISVVEVLYSSVSDDTALRTIESEVVVGEDPAASDLIGLLSELTLAADEILPERVGNTEHAVAIAMVVQPSFNLKRTVTKMILKILRPLLLNLRVLMVNDDVRDRILTELEDRSVDQRVGEEVVTTPPEQLLDGDRQVGVSDIEEWAWVIDTLDTGATDTPTSLGKAHRA